MNPYPEELALDETGGEKCIIGCTNPAGYEGCVHDFIKFNMLGKRMHWFECECPCTDISEILT